VLNELSVMSAECDVEDVTESQELCQWDPSGSTIQVRHYFLTEPEGWWVVSVQSSRSTKRRVRVRENELPVSVRKPAGTLDRAEKERNSVEETWRARTAFLACIYPNLAAEACGCC
jgi:hypothetical protein